MDSSGDLEEVMRLENERGSQDLASPMTALRALSSPGLMIDAEIGRIVRNYSRETQPAVL